MRARADIVAHIYLPHKRTVQFICVDIRLARSSARSGVLCVRRTPKHDQFILAVTVKVAVCAVARRIYAVIDTVTVHGKVVALGSFGHGYLYVVTLRCRIRL